MASKPAYPVQRPVITPPRRPRPFVRVAGAALTALAVSAIVVFGSTQPQLQFFGMASVFGLSKADKSGMLRQADCSLTQFGFSPSTKMLVPATNFQDTLHQLAGLTTKADVFAKGCKDPILGVASNVGAYLGKTPAGQYLGVQGATDHVTDLVVYGANPGTLSYSSTTLAKNVFPQMLGVDLNHDGFTDIVATGVTDPQTQNKGVGVFLGNGDGTFKAGVVYPLTTLANQAFIIDDLNGDGIPDILVPNTSASGATVLTALLGKGDGTFTMGPSTPMNLSTVFSLYGLSQPIATGDFNGDGKVDVLTVDGKLYLGNGDGSFAAGVQALPVYPFYAITGAFAVGDFNGDGKLDVAQLVTSVNPSGTLIIYAGNGAGAFTQISAYDAIPEGAALVATDIDGDGNLDLAVARESHGAFGAAGLGNATTANGWYYQVLLGRGDGTFAGAPVTVGAIPVTLAATISDNPTTSFYTTADFNNDGKEDLISPTPGTNVGPGPMSLNVALGRGDGSFGPPMVAVTNVVPTVVAAADLNGDGKMDVVTLGSNANGGLTLAVLFGNGDGTLAGELDYPMPTSGTRIAIGDFNGDGLPDIAVAGGPCQSCGANYATGVFVLYGQAGHTFSAPAPLVSSPLLVDGAAATPIIAAGDVNGDGLTDLVVASPAAASTSGAAPSTVIHVYLGKSDKTFSGFTPALPAIAVSDLVLTDINRDGKLDIVIGASDQNLAAQVAVLLGFGDGSFAPAMQTLIAGGAPGPAPVIAVADFNGDGNPDAAFFIGSVFSGVLFGAGDGTLPTQVSMPVFSPMGPATPRAVDLNGDKRPDLMFADGNANVIVSLINQWGLSAGTAATSTALTVAPNSVVAGQAVTLSATVTTSAGGTLTGTVTFLSGGTQIGSAALSAQGIATLTTTGMPAGAQSLSAQYSGNSIFAASTSNSVSLTVSAASPGFSIAIAPASGSVSAGATSTATVTLSASGGYSGMVSLACSGLPAGAACTFSPPSVTLSGAAQTAVMSITTAMPTAQLLTVPGSDPTSPGPPFAPLLAVLLAPLTTRCRRRRGKPGNSRRLTWLGWVLMAGALTYGCHGGSSGGMSTPSGRTPAGTYTVTVTATGGSSSQTTTYTLTVT